MKYTSTLLATILLFSSYTFSQAPAKEWDADFGGSENEHLSDVQQTKDGGYLAGYQEARFDRGALAAGFYFLRVKTNDRVVVKKIVVD